MTTLVVCLLGFSNLVLAMSTFILLARPDKMMGLLAYLSGDIRSWRLGTLVQQDQQRLMLLGNQLQIPALVLLFGWSFFCGAAIRFLYAL